ncbi:MAG: N-acetylmuramoyl-L-alanine amidase [Bacteroidia bacterium]|nr:N-acetylmuramoyl-L-alanine amidase [Bacteroidia bacterium]
MIQLVPMLIGASLPVIRHLAFKDLVDRLPKGAGSYKTRRLSDIKTLVLHHSSDPNGDPFSYAAFHTRPELSGGRGWPGIGYHYIIQPNGVIYKCNRHRTISYHVKNGNSDKLGICFTGNFNVDHPTQAQIIAGKFLLNYLRLTIPSVKHIGVHRDYTNTSCPGDNFSIDMVI